MERFNLPRIRRNLRRSAKSLGILLGIVTIVALLPTILGLFNGSSTTPCPPFALAPDGSPCAFSSGADDGGTPFFALYMLVLGPFFLVAGVSLFLFVLYLAVWGVVETTYRVKGWPLAGDADEAVRIGPMWRGVCSLFLLLIFLALAIILSRPFR